jgi:subtilisin family serine protease
MDFTTEDSFYSQGLKDTIDDLTRLGAHIVVPAGNDGHSINSVLARMPGVITVGASTLDDRRASFSNFGPELDVFAPGKNIWSACNSTDKVSPLY